MRLVTLSKCTDSFFPDRLMTCIVVAMVPVLVRLEEWKRRVAAKNNETSPRSGRMLGALTKWREAILRLPAVSRLPAVQRL